MAFTDIDQASLESLFPGYRSRWILPGPVPPSRGNAPSTQDASFAVADELMLVLPFEAVAPNAHTYPGQYQPATANPVAEPSFTARQGGNPLESGATEPFGEQIRLEGSRFKKLSAVVRVDPSMEGALVSDVLEEQIRLASIGIARSLGEAIFVSIPASDDERELAGLPYYLGLNSPQDVLFDPSRGLRGGLAEIVARAQPSDGDMGARPDVIVCSSRCRWRLIYELESLGVAPDYRYSNVTGSLSLHYHGIPVISGRVPEPTGGTTEAWALKLYGPSGVRQRHIGGESDRYGIRTREITTMVNYDGAGEAAIATRGSEVFGIYSLLVPERASIARLRGIPIEDPYSSGP